MMTESAKRKEPPDLAVITADGDDDEQEATASLADSDLLSHSKVDLRFEQELAAILIDDLIKQQEENYNKLEDESRATMMKTAAESEGAFKRTATMIQNARKEAEKLFAVSDSDNAAMSAIITASMGEGLHRKTHELTATTSSGDAEKTLMAALATRDGCVQRDEAATNWRRKVIRDHDQLFLQAEARFKDKIATERRVAAIRDLIWPHSAKE